MNLLEPTHDRRIRSFIRRQGKLTPGQQRALDNLWQNYGLDPSLTDDFKTVFGRDAELVMEIGFGDGESLLAMAIANPDLNYIGIEVHQPGVGHLMLKLHEFNVTNVRIYNHDAVEILEQRIPDNSLVGVQLFFPDPWHKTRHHKRRIVNAAFLKLLSRKLKAGGYFHAATDWQHYAEHMLTTLSSEPAFNNASLTNDYCERPDYRPLTKFENRGLRLGHGVWDLIFIKPA
ncbi:MAG: tRNA (guanosine(46)-N7)-methyltransferase TrmB [Methylococcaceae bacterium]|nr:tRNA (guanosine(46)-N7)-methyltransferase TrmB [Methylococcaceae bacterium]